MSSGAERALQGSQSLKTLIEEATAALGRMDAERLAELALSCEALNRELPAGSAEARRRSAEVREAGKAMRVFLRVLDATRANAEFLRRLREPSGQLEYGPRWSAGWSVDGNH